MLPVSPSIAFLKDLDCLTVTLILTGALGTVYVSGLDMREGWWSLVFIVAFRAEEGRGEEGKGVRSSQASVCFSLQLGVGGIFTLTRASEGP